jgi:hypothetical protein
MTESGTSLDAMNDAFRAATRGCVHLHAAAVETSSGVIALAGRSHSGKSTVAAAAVLAGYRYVADEVTAIDPDNLTVHPFHRPIGLRCGGAHAIGVAYPDDDRAVEPWIVDDHHRSDGGALAGIALVAWTAGAAPSVADIEPAPALTRLTEHTFDPDASTFAGLARIARTVPTVELHYATTADGLGLIATLVGRWSR